MKKITAFTVAALMIGGIAFTSCKKYEEGPALTILTKKARVAGTWEVEAYLVDGVDKTSDYRAFITSESLEFTKDGTYNTSTTTVLGTDTDAGTWEFVNDKEDLKTLSNTAGSTPDTMMIVKLKNKEMWVRSKTGTPVYELHYKAK
jgi:hypothetical protein